MYDPEAIYQDADIEMLEMREAAAELEAEAKALGVTVEEILAQREADWEREQKEIEAYKAEMRRQQAEYRRSMRKGAGR
jgi:hypothetical protein